MKPTEILRQCKLKSISLKAVGNQLHYEAPKGSMTDNLKRQLRQHKPEIIKLLLTDRHSDKALGDKCEKCGTEDASVMLHTDSQSFCTKCFPLPKVGTDYPFDYDRCVEAVIAELNQRNMKWTDFPQTTRARANELDKQMTEAANRGDRGGFLKLLRQWRHCFH